MQTGTAAYDPSMDPGYPPDNALPDILRNEMQLLLHLDSLRHAQVQKVIGIAVSVWQGIEKGAEASAAELAREEERAEDWGTSEASTSEEAAEEKAYFEAFTSLSKCESDHVSVVDPADRDHRHRNTRGPSAITGYYGVKRALSTGRYLATVNRRSYGTYATAEQAAHAYDGAALRNNIALGYNKHKLNFSRARTKKTPAVQHEPEAQLGEDSSESGSDSSRI